MSVRTRGVAQNSAFALAGDLASKGGTLAVMMVAGHGLRTAEFAALATALSAATVLTALLDLGSQTLLTRDGVDGPGARAALLRALALARLPLLAVSALAAVLAGLALGRPLVAVATVLLAAAGAAQLSLTGVLRAAQDLRPEAGAKLAGGLLMLGAAGACVALAPSAGTLLIAVAAASVLALVPLVVAVRRVTELGARDDAAPHRPGPAVGPWAALRRAAPLGAMALATLAYYRAGTLALSVLSTSGQTARFAAASTLAFGLLVVANAGTTGLLPRLVATRDPRARAALARRALAAITGLGLLLGGGVALCARPLLVLAFGPGFADGAGALTLLAAATVLIAPAGVLGTVLVAERRLRPVGVQVAASLVVNVAALALLAPAHGATGAALATVACEALALVLLGRAALRALPALAARPARVATVAPASLAGVTE